MKKLHMALIVLVFIVGGVVGFLMAGSPSYAGKVQPSQIRSYLAKTMADMALDPVAVDVRVASRLKSGEMTREEAAEALEESSASLLMQLLALRPPVRELDFNANQGLCAAYVYINQGGYSHLGSTSLRNVLKGYLDKSGPEAIRELRKVRSILGQEPLKPKYAKQLHLKARANAAESAMAPIDVNSFPLKNCYKGPTE